MKFHYLLLLILPFTSCTQEELPVTAGKSDMVFPSLSTTWDEGVPLGNATVGALVWQRDSVLRFSLDRIDLWDLRPTDSISGPNNKFRWVMEQVRKGDYLPVQKKFDWPYDREPAPSKIPGAALEFHTTGFGKVKDVHLYLRNALCRTEWSNGTVLKTFVHASEPIGWFVFENLPDAPAISIVPPQYESETSNGTEDPVTGQDLRRLGYRQGNIEKKENCITYHQQGWNGFYYDVNVRWEKKGRKLYGVWSVTSYMTGQKASSETMDAMKRGVYSDFSSHNSYWKNFWNASSVSVPDSIIQRQYDQEMYRLGSVARKDSYPISLQAIWTADNGKLPPWKGDYHHDLNTQLSYWPVYKGNHLEEGMGYLNTLWNQREVYKKYTRTYFECEGMNIPGVCTLTGEPMGGWIQYSMSPTVSAWLSQHFYLHWKYSADKEFLTDRAYPFVHDVALFLEQITLLDSNGIRKLPISSSPEIFDNSLNAWFRTMTNYDLALIQFAFRAAEEMAGALGKDEEATHWKELYGQLPDYDLDADGALTFAKGFPYNASHRHFSHAMAIHPLGLLDYSQGEKARKIIDATLQKLKDNGPDWWCGYSYSWFANMSARAMKGEDARDALRTFAECFCLTNGFHANGDQSQSGKSKFTYRPFTLEGNFAFAAALQEMLLQSHTGKIHIFPALPNDWKDLSFEKLRAEGAFIVSASLRGGKLAHAEIMAEQGGTLQVINSFGPEYQLKIGDKYLQDTEGIWKVTLSKGEKCTIEAVGQ
jgi:alpha-L-fucosidase 2